MSNMQILLLIAAFLTLTLGSFFYYVATWSDRQEAAIGYHFAKNTPAGGVGTPDTLSPEQKRALT